MIKHFIFILITFLFINTSYAVSGDFIAPSTLSGTNIYTGTWDWITPIDNVSNWIDVINNKKKELINDLSWVDTLTSKITDLENEIQQKKIQNNTLLELNNWYEKKIEEITKNNEKLTKWLEQEISYYKKAIETNNNTIATIKSEQINTTLILENLSKLKLELDDKQNSIYYNKLMNLIIILLFIVSWYLITSFLYNKEKHDTEYFTNSSKKIARLNISNVIFTILFIFLILFGSIYLRPEYAIWLLFFGSSFIVIFKDTIVSFIASIFVILNYDIGDMLGYEVSWFKTNGVLVKVTPLHMNIKEYNDSKWIFTWRIVKIPNKVLFENSIIKNSNNYSNLVQEDILLPVATKWMVEKTENKHLPNQYITKLGNIENILNEELTVYWLEELWIFSDFYDTKYKKQFINDKDNNIFVEYVWLRKKNDSDIVKEKILKEFFL